MKKFSNITILILSIGLASAPVLARQAVDPTDYVGYTHAYIPTESVRQEHTRELTQSGQNANDHESRRIGKLLWKSDSVQSDHSKWSGTKMLEWPLLWKNSHAQGELEWPLLWKIAHVQSSHGNVN